MVDREGFRHTAGGDKTLSIIRHGGGEMTQTEASNGESNPIFPGAAVHITTNAEGYRVFEYHDGSEGNAVYIVTPARGRGMDAQTDEGFETGELLAACRASGGGLNVLLKSGENVDVGDAISPEAGTGLFTAADTSDPAFEVDEKLDLSGATESALVAVEVVN